jgi:hypothetical protein
MSIAERNALRQTGRCEAHIAELSAMITLQLLVAQGLAMYLPTKTASIEGHTSCCR